MSQEPSPRKPSPAPLFLAGAGALALVLAGFTAWWFLYRTRKRDELRRVACTSRLCQIGLAIQMYADDYDGAHPLSFKELYPDYIDYATVFWCPGVPKGSVSWQDFKGVGPITERSTSYTYERGLDGKMPPGLILAFDKSLENHRGAGRNVLLVYGNVAWWPAEREEEFQEALAEQREALKKWRAAGGRDGDFKKFFGKVRGVELGPDGRTVK